MKTAFYSTDCSIDSALALRRWQAANPDAGIRLTLVHAYDIENGVNLTKTAYQVARQHAQERLEQWLTMLTQSWLGELKPETLLASPELAVSMHLLFRSYDYLLVDDQVISALQQVE